MPASAWRLSPATMTYDLDDLLTPAAIARGGARRVSWRPWGGGEVLVTAAFDDGGEPARWIVELPEDAIVPPRRRSGEVAGGCVSTRLPRLDTRLSAAHRAAREAWRRALQRGDAAGAGAAGRELHALRLEIDKPRRDALARATGLSDASCALIARFAGRDDAVPVETVRRGLELDDPGMVGAGADLAARRGAPRAEVLGALASFRRRAPSLPGARVEHVPLPSHEGWVAPRALVELLPHPRSVPPEFPVRVYGRPLFA